MLEVNVKITVAPGEDYTPTEAAVLQALAGTAGQWPPAPAAAAEAKAAAAPAAAPAPAEEKPAPAAKPAAKRTAKPKPAAKPAPEPAAEPEADEEPEDEPTGPAVLEDDAAAPTATLTVQDALAVAGPIVTEEGDAGRARVKAALDQVGAARVSALTGDSIPAFIAALQEG